MDAQRGCLIKSEAPEDVWLQVYFLSCILKGGVETMEVKLEDFEQKQGRGPRSGNIVISIEEV